MLSNHFYLSNTLIDSIESPGTCGGIEKVRAGVGVKVNSIIAPYLTLSLFLVLSYSFLSTFNTTPLESRTS